MEPVAPRRTTFLGVVILMSGLVRVYHFDGVDSLQCNSKALTAYATFLGIGH